MINKTIASIELLDICGVNQTKDLATFIIAANLASKA